MSLNNKENKSIDCIEILNEYTMILKKILDKWKDKEYY